MKNSTQGFTLIELLIVIAIIGILAAVLIPNLLGARKRAYDTAAQSCAKSIQTAQATFQIDRQAYVDIDKTVGTANNITLGAADTSSNTVTPTDNAAALAAGLNSGCADINMEIVGTITAANAGTGAAATYSIAVKDRRGQRTFIATPDSLSGS
ncbi:type IV pilin protein [Deinococcus ficus]|uniref:type IV pilin protein n=1 Tax=Deinococcus ficus TaxID=317577 RepID=UPI0003B533B4|nr:type II secretion system protein [Deinococcus ficus]